MNWRTKLRALFRKEKLDAEMAEEMRHHLDAQVRRNLAAGMSLDEAHAAARRSFGGIEQIKERARDQRGWGWLEDLVRDVRFASRALRKTPGFTLVAVATLALGIGANTAIFSRVDQLLLRVLPVVAPERLVLLAPPSKDRQPEFSSFSYPAFRDYQRAGAALADFSALGELPVGLGVGDSTERQRALLVSGNYFSLLGVQPALGRGFAANEGAEIDDAFVVVLSHGLWVRRFGADPQVLGQTVVLNGRPFTVIGVAPREFTGTTRGRSFDLYVPLTAYGQLTTDRTAGRNPLSERNLVWLSLIGRLRGGVAPTQAQAAVQGIFEESRRSNNRGASSPTPQLLVLPGEQGFPGEMQQGRRPLQLLFATGGLVLLIACANLANLQLARAAGRTREFAVRLAIGAGRGRLIRQLLTESLLLALLGGGLGLLVAYGLAGALRSWLPSSDAGLDARVLGFTLVVSLLTGLVFGLMPALRASRPDLVPELKGARSRDGGRSRWSLRGALVVLQVALSLLVLVSAGLCVRSLKKLQDLDPGYATSPVVLLSFDLGLNNASSAQSTEFYARLLERTRALPGVETAGLAQSTPLSGRTGGTSISRIEGYDPAPNERLSADMNLVSPGYFRTVGLPLLRGRDFNDSDSATGLKVVVVNDTFAQRRWPGQDPMGKRIYFPGPGGGTMAEVIGVVQPAHSRAVNEAPRAALFFPVTQAPARDLTLAVRTAIDPGAITAALRREVKAIDPTVPIVRVRTLAQQKADSLTLQRMAATLLSGFGALALLLAALGIYGVLSYTVAARTQEIGVRIALGATVRDVLRLVLKQGFGLVGAGVAVGLAAAFGATRLLQSFLYEVTPQDPLTFAGAVALLGVVALVACWVPGRRATRISPLTALRTE